MEFTFNVGQLVKVVSHLESPHGLCLSKTQGTVFVADGHNIREVDLEAKSVKVVASSFKQAFDVGSSSDGNLGVTDVQGHKTFILEQEQDANSYKVKSTIGTGNVGLSDGPAAKAKLSESTGMCFDFDSVIFCCFGGSKAGYIKVHSSVDFACKFMAKFKQIYHAKGFFPKKEKTVWLSWERIPQLHL